MILVATMSLNPRFFSQPVRYLRWAAIEKPAIFWSLILGSMGPAMFVVVPPIRRALGDDPIPKIPLTYPSTFPKPPPAHRGAMLSRLQD